MTQRYDVAVVGGGIVGLAHAWMAARRGLQVVLLERSAAAHGASVRNFGMIWPIGQPEGEAYAIAMRARELWLELSENHVLPVQQCGSIHLAHREDEWAVLQEFCASTPHDVQLLTPQEVLRRSALAQPDRLLGGMWSSTELRVDPRTASANIAAWLQQHHAVTCCFQTHITRIADGTAESSDGRSWHADHFIVCSNDDLQTLFPDALRQSGLRRCKLQMLRSVPQPDAPASPPHIASGLTLRHYTSFANCPTLNALKQRVAEETPELDRFGIHVMASQFPSGEVVLGDSHEYDAEITPFDNADIDAFILRELRKVIQLSDWTINQRWHGIYAKHTTQPVFRMDLPGGIHLCVGTGGAGMTLAFGLADQTWNSWS